METGNLALCHGNRVCRVPPGLIYLNMISFWFHLNKNQTAEKEIHYFILFHFISFHLTRVCYSLSAGARCQRVQEVSGLGEQM